MPSPPIGRIGSRLFSVFVALAIAAMLFLAPTPSPTASIGNLNCGIRAAYECIYVSISGDGSGSVTFKSYQLLGVGDTIHTVGLGSCIREGGATSGSCTLGFSYLGLSPTGVTVAFHSAVQTESCFSYQGGGCTTPAFDESRDFAITPTVGDSDFAFNLQNPATMTIHLQGTGTGTVTSSPSGINCPGTCSAHFAAGTQVALTETPTSGDTFGGWGQLCLSSGLGSPTCTFTMPSKGATLGISPTFNAPTPPPPTPTPTPTPKATATPKPTALSTPTPHPTAPATPKPSSAAVNPTQLAPASELPASGPPATGPVAVTQEPTAAPAATDNGPVAQASPSLAPLDTPNADLGATTSSGSSQPLLIGGMVVLLIVLGGGAAFFFRKQRGIPGQ
jgi:hypothetical protein